MSYDTLKESNWLIDKDVEQKARVKAREKNISPGEAFRKMAKTGFNHF